MRTLRSRREQSVHLKGHTEGSSCLRFEFIVMTRVVTAEQHAEVRRRNARRLARRHARSSAGNSSDDSAAAMQSRGSP